MDFSSSWNNISMGVNDADTGDFKEGFVVQELLYRYSLLLRWWLIDWILVLVSIVIPVAKIWTWSVRERFEDLT